MKAALAVLIVVLLAGCGMLTPGEPIALAKRTDPYTPYCHTNFTHGTLIPDASAGTAIIQDVADGGQTLPVLWPDGFTGRRMGDVVTVLDADGNVIAQTGHHYQFWGGYDDQGWRGCADVTPD